MADSLLSPAFLFRFSTSCRHAGKLWPQRAGELGQEYVMPSFGELEGRPHFADFRLAWNDAGLEVQLKVTGKSQEAWCRDTRAEDSDGISIWIDTRDAHNIHRASRFCHRFVFLPFGAGARSEHPVGFLLPINRARELPKPIDPRILQMESRKRKDGYELRSFIPAEAMTGYDPAEHPKLGFSYAVMDRELGWQTFTVGPEFPFVEDPSLWGTIELTGGK